MAHSLSIEIKTDSSLPSWKIAPLITTRERDLCVISNNYVHIFTVFSAPPCLTSFSVQNVCLCYVLRYRWAFSQPTTMFCHFSARPSDAFSFPWLPLLHNYIRHPSMSSNVILIEPSSHAHTLCATSACSAENGKPRTTRRVPW